MTTHSDTPARAGSSLDVLGSTIEVVLSAEDTNGAASVVRASIPPRWALPAHLHLFEDELFHVLDGAVEITVGGHPALVERGASAFGPRRTPHALRNVSDHPATLLISTSPGGIEMFFRAVHDVCAAGAPEPAVILDIMERHGMRTA